MTSEIKYHTNEEAIAAVTQNGTKLKFCTPELRNDEEVVMAAIKEDEFSFQYASDEFKSNKAFILKAIHEGIGFWELIKWSSEIIRSDIEVMSLALEKSNNGFVFIFAKGEVALNKELAAKALVKWENYRRADDFGLWKGIHSTLQEFFPKECWYEKAQAYLIQLNQKKQAEVVSGGSTEEDTVVW